MARRRRKHFCSYGWTSKRDADIEAKLLRGAGHKSKVTPAGGGFKVCTTFRGKRRKHARY
jgi:hypothetical protein